MADMSERSAPLQLQVVQDFANTQDDDARSDSMDTPAKARAWLVERGLLAKSARLDADAYARVLSFRDALRCALIEREDGSVGTAVLARLNAAAASAPIALRFGEDGTPGFEAAGTGVDAAVARLMAVIATAAADGTWERLKICREGTCRWVFYDPSKNRSKHWCSMRVCGNRAKARAYRRRKAGE